MKDFDTERRERRTAREADRDGRSFILNGETFVYRAEVSYTVLEDISAIGDEGGANIIQNLERSILDMLEEGQEELFLATVRSKDEPVTLADLNDLASWLTEAQTGRPTEAPSASTDGRDTTGTSSTEGSSSELVEASAA